MGRLIKCPLAAPELEPEFEEIWETMPGERILGIISISTIRGKWSEGIYWCGHPAILFSRSQFVSKGPKTPSTDMFVFEQKM